VKSFPASLVSLLLALPPATLASAEIAVGDNSGFFVYGDLRGRLEQDWDSTKGDGSQREDRLRLRIRARLGLDYRREHVTAGVRLRTGADNNQQSGNITIYDFDGNKNGDADLNFDKWFLQYRRDGLSAWVGRNSFEWWRQDQLMWDDDVVPAGLALAWTATLGESRTLTLNGGAYKMPEGMTDFRGDLFAGQVVYDANWNDTGLTLAAGIQRIDAEPIDNPCPPGAPEGAGGCEGDLLLQGNGNRDYTMLSANLQARLGDIAGKPFGIGLDLQHNTEDYGDAADAFARFHQDNDTSWVLGLSWGKVKKKGDWELAYFYAWQDMLSINNSYTQDDWTRWGSGGQARVSNFKGSEFRAAWGLANRVKAVLRLWLVDAIDYTEPGDASKEDGNRLRLDVSYKF
jgi:hypothetical protein